MRFASWPAFVLSSFLLANCHSPTTKFTELGPDETGVRFVNTLTDTPEQNILTYEYHYNGGGLATGDLNGDGSPDLYISGNIVPNQLYLNRTGLRQTGSRQTGSRQTGSRQTGSRQTVSSSTAIEFEDVTAQTGTAGRVGDWKTGVTFADVNADGWLDIYVSYAGQRPVSQRANQLFINQRCEPGGIPIFREQAAEYGLDAPGTFTTQTVFFDMDADGDLDCFMVNHADMFYNPYFNTRKVRTKRHPYFGNRLYENRGQGAQPQYADVSDKAGILGGGVNFGLGVAISDLNGDDRPDIYVTNDYDEQDYCYLNQGNGRFLDVSHQSFGHLSRNSMGVEAADMTNDAQPDLLVLDMLPEDNHRQKLLKGPDPYDRYQMAIDSGYHQQVMRNTFQVHQGINNAQTPLFSECGAMAGIAATDWSWSVLAGDWDNDGWKDYFITNGHVRDMSNLDFVKYDFEDAQQLAKQTGQPTNALALIQKMPASVVRNYLFQNTGNQTFTNVSASWGAGEPGVSTASSYADLDGDGDLDLLVYNQNAPVSILQNNSRQQPDSAAHFLRLKLVGTGGNTQALGAKIWLTTDRGEQYQELQTARGFQSSVEPVVHFGVGSSARIRQVRVRWPDGRESVLANLGINKVLTISQKTARFPSPVPAQPVMPIFQLVDKVPAFRHTENGYVDYKNEPLIPYALSRQGPAGAVADVNGDGWPDVFAGGAAGQAGQLLLGQSGGGFRPAAAQPWVGDRASEDVAALLFDADGDRDVDLYVVSGGHEFSADSPDLQDRLYLNDGQGRFTKASNALPPDANAGSCVTAADYDRDGDLDLFVGSRSVPQRFGEMPRSMLLRNNTPPGGPVRFTNVTPPALERVGMVTSAVWTDTNADTRPDLLVVGHWMAPALFINQNGKLVHGTKTGLANLAGFWNVVVARDIDHDGDDDFLLGNVGQNSLWQASPKQPLELLVGDFNADGRPDPLLCAYSQGKSYPIATRDELLDQLTVLRRKFILYADYADATLNQVLTANQRAGGKVYQVCETRSGYVENRGRAGFVFHPLPTDAQLAPVNAFWVGDVNGDNHNDVLLAGNNRHYRVQHGPMDAGYGLLLIGNSRGGFQSVSRVKSGLSLSGQVSQLLTVGNRTICALRNDDTAECLQF